MLAERYVQIRRMDGLLNDDPTLLYCDILPTLL